MTQKIGRCREWLQKTGSRHTFDLLAQNRSLRLQALFNKTAVISMDPALAIAQ